MLDDMGGLTKLTNLDLSDSSVQELPEDFGKLQSLVYFYARGVPSCQGYWNQSVSWPTWKH